MEPIDAGISGTSASGLTLGVVAGFKFYVPNAPSWVVFTVSIVAGCVLAALYGLRDGVVFDGAGIANVVIAGLAGGLTAAGISRADRAADEKRALAQQQEYMRP